MKKKVDVAIVGGGVVGMALALSLSKLGHSVIIIEKKSMQIKDIDLDLSTYDTRIFALNHTARNFLNQLEIDIRSFSHTTEFESMALWSRSKNQALTLTDKDHTYPCLGYIVEHRQLMTQLMKAIKESSQIEVYDDTNIDGLTSEGNITFEDGSHLEAQWIIGADGGHSIVREKIGFKVTEKEYHQSALIMNVQHTHSHDKTAYQCFENNETLAFLPLINSFHSSIVWSNDSDEIKKLQSLPENQLMHRLAEASDYRLGQCQLLSDVNTFPLKSLHVKNYKKNKVILVGDAAHVLHPMAGWGMNLGLQDAATLMQCINRYLKQNQPLHQVTERAFLRYERYRRSHNQTMMLIINLLRQAFRADIPYNWIQSMNKLKRIMVKIAQGEQSIIKLLK